MKLKAVVTIYSYVLYVIITLGLIVLVYSSAIVTSNKAQEQHNYDRMIEAIQKIDAEIKTVSQNIDSVSQISVENPEELEINCEDNELYGLVTYNQDFVDDGLKVNNIFVAKQYNNINFNVYYGVNDNINLVCDSNIIYLNKRLNTINISYEEYDNVEEKINIRISLFDFLE